MGGKYWESWGIFREFCQSGKVGTMILSHDEREYGVLPLIRGLYSGKIQWRSHWCQWSLASCHTTEVSLVEEHSMDDLGMGMAFTLVWDTRVCHRGLQACHACDRSLHHGQLSHGTPSPQQTDKHVWKHYLPANSLADGNQLTPEACFVFHRLWQCKWAICLSSRDSQHRRYLLLFTRWSNLFGRSHKCTLSQWLKSQEVTVIKPLINPG